MRPNSHRLVKMPRDRLLTHTRQAMAAEWEAGRRNRLVRRVSQKGRDHAQRIGVETEQRHRRTPCHVWGCCAARAETQKSLQALEQSAGRALCARSGSRDAAFRPAIWSDWRLLGRREHATGPRARERGQENMAKPPAGTCGSASSIMRRSDIGGANSFSLRHDRLDALGYRCAMNAEMFNLYTKTQLVPTLRAGVVILDTFPATRAMPRRRNERFGAWFLLLPPLHPDLNRSNAFAKLKAMIRKVPHEPRSTMPAVGQVAIWSPTRKLQPFKPQGMRSIAEQALNYSCISCTSSPMRVCCIGLMSSAPE